MTRSRLLAIAAGVAALVFSAGTALALGTGGADDGTLGGVATTSESTAPGSAEDRPTVTASPAAGAAVDVISAEQAARIAAEHVGGGTVVEIERELEHGRVEWKVRVLNAGQRFDVRVDATTGAVTRVDSDTDSDTARRDGQPTGTTAAGPTRGDDDPPGDDHGGDGSGHGGSDDGSGSGRGGHDDPPGDDHGTDG